MTVNIDPVYAYVLDNEGPYDDHPNDPGGPTAWGINGADIAALNIDPTTHDDVLRTLQRCDAANYIQQLYADPIHLQEIFPPAIAAKVLDNALWLGPGTAIGILQRACIALGHDLQVDNILGPHTATAANQSHPTTLCALMASATLRRVLQVLANEKHVIPFREGWLRRALRIPPLGFGG